MDANLHSVFINLSSSVQEVEEVPVGGVGGGGETVGSHSARIKLMMTQTISVIWDDADSLDWYSPVLLPTDCFHRYVIWNIESKIS